MTRHLVLASVLVAAVAVSACGSSSAPAPAANAAGTGKHVDPATAGTITGHVSFDGVPPAPQLIRMTADPACIAAAGTNTKTDSVLVAPDGSLENVFVYIKSGLDSAYTFDAPTTHAVLDQRGCRYVPHVLGLQVGQPLDIVNSDATLHNVHAIPMQNQEFNYGESQQGMRMTRTFTVPEVMIPFRCNVHGWMNAYVGVLPHPYFSVTGAAGVFTLENVPPGTYTIEAWHEKYGTQTAQVTVGDKQTQTLAFKFAADK